MGRALLATVIGVAVVLILSLMRYVSAPLPSVPADADAADRFLARRGKETLERVVGEGERPRPLGSEANASTRRALAAELKRIGFATETQRSLSCSAHGACGVVENVIGTLDGTSASLGALLLASHYDSVPISPGASDDGIGMAAMLEVARALAAGPRPLRTVVLLFTDGEEDGLLGADAFVASHPLAKRVKLVVNVDARGSSGPSEMFETSRGNAWLVKRMAARLEHPVTTSLFYEAYRRMPNDTDFTAFKRIAHGVNFANTSSIQNYHTPQDALRNLDARTLQHHGDQVLALARALARRGTATRRRRPRAVMPCGSTSSRRGS